MVDNYYPSDHTGAQVDSVVSAWLNKVNTSAEATVLKKQTLIYQNVGGTWKWAAEDLQDNFYTEDEIDTKLDNIYTKEEVYDKTQAYNKTEVYKKEDVYTKLETYNKDEVYNKTESYNKDETDSLLTGKIDNGEGDGTRFLSDDNIWRYLPTPLDGSVTGIRGSAEQDFRTGNVVITKDDLGLTSELDGLRSDIDILIDESISSVKETSFESTVLEIPNTGEGFLNDFDEKGKSVQDIEPYPNLFDINTLTNKYDVNTTITNSDITVTATSLGTYRRVRSTNFILPAGTYYLHRDFEIISGTSTGSAGMAILYEVGTNNNIRNNNGSFTLLNTTEVYLGLYLSTNSALVDLLSVRFYNIQIVQGSFTAETVPDWTPYGKPSALPWASSDINSVPYEHNVISCGKNLLNNGGLPRTSYGVTLSYDSDTDEYILNGSYNGGSWGTDLFITTKRVCPIKSGEVFTLSVYKTQAVENENIIGTGSFAFYINKGISYNNSENWIGMQIDDLYSSKSATASDDGLFVYRARLVVVPGVTFNDYRLKLMISKHSITPTSIPPYEQYTGKTLPRSVTDIAGNHYDLRSLPDGTADEVDWGNYLLQPYTARIKVQPSFSNLTGTNWQREGYFSCYSINNTIPTAVSGSSMSLCNLRCSHFKRGNWEWTGLTFPNAYILANGSSTSGRTNIHIIAPNDIFGIVSEDTDAEKFTKVNTWFTNNDVYLEYQLMTPPEPIPLRKYGETYDGVVWDKNEPVPTQSGYTTVYTNASPQPTLNAREWEFAQIGDEVILKVPDETNPGIEKPINPLTTDNLVLFPDGERLRKKWNKVQMKGTPIWDSETGAIEITTLTLTEGHIYDIYFGRSANIQKISVLYINGGYCRANISYDTTNSEAVTAEIEFEPNGNINISTKLLTDVNNYATNSTFFKIFKIVDMGEMSLNEVT